MPDTPYADTAKRYLKLGWFPLPVTGKHPPVKGATGREGTVTTAKVKTWRDSHAEKNVGLRLHGVVAIDVDHGYDGKLGGDQLIELETRYGALPPTYTSTARGKKTPSRQRFYRVPEGVEFRAQPAPDIEIVQAHHRYSVVWPSRHPEGRRYRWYSPGGERYDGIPRVDDLPMLPEAWVDALRTDAARRDPDASWEELVDASASGEPTAEMLDVQRQASEADHVGHNTFRDLSLRALALAAEGHAGARATIDDLIERFREHMLGKGGKSGRQANSEVNRLLKGAAELVAAKPRPATFDLPKPEPIEPVTLAECDDTFRGWLGGDYDLGAMHAVLAAAVIERMDGDPAWLLLISGSGNAKTETVQALAGAGARVVSSIASAGALLSGTSKGERSKTATGGLLRELGARGVLVPKDVTSMLSMDRTARAEVFAALREVHDGRWTRSVGTDGGRSLEWEGRIVVIGAVTTAWDRAHADTISAFGDRFVVVRMDSTKGRIAAGWKAIGNTGSEEAMRSDLSRAVAGVIEGADLSATGPDGEETRRILAAADVVTLARTAVDHDYRGNVVDSHAPEMPTRFAKQLAQIFRGAVAIGLARDEALALAIRCARDSMPPLRLEALEDVAAHPWTRLSDAVKRLQKPRPTVDRQLQALHLLGMVALDNEVTISGMALRETTTWRYTVAEGIDVSAIALDPSPKKSTNKGKKK